uniref:Transposase n=1 Tax=Acrobeloides nanus TaxID=290746 RepID=A0A914CXZ2_9BILA
MKKLRLKKTIRSKEEATTAKLSDKLQAITKKRRRQITKESAYSPDLNPVDYKFNHGMNTAFENRRFHSEEEIKEAVTEYIESKQPSFWHDAIYQLPDRWNYVVENEGKYYID